MEGGSPRREVAAADRRWGPGGGGRDAPSSFSSSRCRRRRRPPESGRGLRGTGCLCGRESRPPPSTPPPPPQPRTSSRAPRTRLAHTHPPPPTAARLPEPQAPPTPARREAVAKGRGTGLSGACARRGPRHGERAGVGDLERVRGGGGWGGLARGARGRQLLRPGQVGSSPPRPSCGRGSWDKRSTTERTFLALCGEALTPAAPLSSFVTAGSLARFLLGKEAGKGS